MSKFIETELIYQDGDTRKYKFNAVDSITPNAARTKAKAVNASLSGGTDGGLSQTFISDGGANLTKINSVAIISEVDTNIFGGDF